MPTCSRCGQNVSHVDYGSDGLAYCQSCIFYGMNKQCWKCRMYLPASEMQQYRGQWTCPICISHMREEDRKENEYKGGDERFRAYAYSEYCDRCGRDLDIVYVLNGRKLCRSCVDAEQKKWEVVGGGPSGASQRVTIRPLRVTSELSLLEKIINEFLFRLGLKKKKKVQIVAIKPDIPVRRAKPMSEGRMRKGSEPQGGQVEGLMKEEQRAPESEGIQKKPRKRKKSGKKGKKK